MGADGADRWAPLYSETTVEAPVPFWTAVRSMAQLVDACGARSGLGRNRQCMGSNGLAWLYVMYARTAARCCEEGMEHSNLSNGNCEV